MKILFVIVFAALGLAFCGVARDVEIKEGDCWTYATRPGEEGSFLVIRKIETLPKVGEVVHISVFGVKIKNAADRTGFTGEVAHLPVAGENLRASLKDKVEKKVPDIAWKTGYGVWRKGFDAQRAGVFRKSVSECITYVEESLNQPDKK